MKLSDLSKEELESMLRHCQAMFHEANQAIKTIAEYRYPPVIADNNTPEMMMRHTALSANRFIKEFSNKILKYSEPNPGPERQSIVGYEFNKDWEKESDELKARIQKAPSFMARSYCEDVNYSLTVSLKWQCATCLEIIDTFTDRKTYPQCEKCNKFNPLTNHPT